jgi:hypothetical protein
MPTSELDSVFDSLALNVYDRIKKQRDKQLKAKRGIVPVYQPNQIVFLVDQTPSPPGVSSVLKTPNTGPYRIDCTVYRRKMCPSQSCKLANKFIPTLN